MSEDMSSGLPPYRESQPANDAREQHASPAIDRTDAIGAMRGGNSFVESLSALASSLSRNVMLALAGALATLFAFFVLPYVSASVEATTPIVTPILDALCGANDCSVSLTAAQALSSDGIVVLVPLLALLGAVVLALATREPAVTEALTPRNGALVAVVAAGLGVLLVLNQFLIAASVVSREVDAANNVGGIAGVHISAGLGFGFWLMALGMLAVLAGAILELRRVS